MSIFDVFKKRRKRALEDEHKTVIHEVHDGDNWIPISVLLNTDTFSGHTEESFSHIPEEPFEGFSGGESGGGGAERSLDSTPDSSDCGVSDCGDCCVGD